jgi:hypothetical protein
MFFEWPSTPHFWSQLGLMRVYFCDEGAVWRPKVKIHGCNTGVVLKGDGRYYAQSRSRPITPGDDLFGFAKWVEDNGETFERLSKSLKREVAIFGEWYGQGIQSGTASASVPGKHWAIFSYIEHAYRGIVKRFHVEPGEIYALGDFPAEAEVIPWYSDPIGVANVHSDNDVTDFLNRINKQVDAVSQEDPFILNQHGISGPGEGLVFYPVADSRTTNGCNYTAGAFKAKGDKHRVFKTNESAEIMPINVKTIPQFADFVLTEERLMQNARAVAKSDCIFEKKLVGPFVAHILKDVKKESKDVIESNGLRWREVSPEVSRQAKEWYESKIS